MRRRSHGFTLVELVIVMILTAVLAVTLLPRLFQTSDFSTRGARDSVLATLRYARSTAIGMRRNVCVGASTTLLTVTYATAAGASQGCVAGNTVVNPANGLPFGDASNTLPGGATLAAAATFVFDAKGTPYSSVGNPLAATSTVTVNGAATAVTIEPETGFIH